MIISIIKYDLGQSSSTVTTCLFPQIQPTLRNLRDSQHLENCKKIFLTPNKEKVITIKNFRPTALTPMVMKCFERIF